MPEDLNDDRTTEQLDAIADGVDTARNDVRPMTEKAPPPTPEVKEPVWDGAGFEFKYKDKAIRPKTKEELMKWVQMGYDRPQVMAQFNQDKSKWEKDKTEWEKKWSTYKEIDEFADKNPEWWKFVEQNWQTRGQQPVQPAQPGQAPQQVAPQPPVDPRYQALEQKFEQVLPIVTQFQQHLQSQEQKTQDDQLKQETQSIQTKYKDLDWESLDENGKNLELRVLEHADANGIKTFKTAFLDLMHDQLVELKANQAKLEVSKGIQKNTKLGVLGTTPTPKGQWTPNKNKDIKSMSYDELAREGLEEELARSKSA